MEHSPAAAGSLTTSVMIVDDDPLFRSLARAWVTEDARLLVGAEAQDGAEAVAQLPGSDVDTLLIDLEMPVMDGLAAAIRARELRPDLRIVMLTGASLSGEREAEVRAAVDILLFKGEISAASFCDALAVRPRGMPPRLHLVPQPSPLEEVHYTARPPAAPWLLPLRIVAGILPPLLFASWGVVLGPTGCVACVVLAAASVPLVATVERRFSGKAPRATTAPQGSA